MKNELQHVETVTAWSLSEKQIASYFLKIIYWYNENKLLGLIFFENKILVKLDVVFDSQSNDCNFSFLAPPGREKKNFNFSYKWKYFFSREKAAPESWNYNHSTQNRKLHQAVVTVCFRKKSPLTFFFIVPLKNFIIKNLDFSLQCSTFFWIIHWTTNDGFHIFG